MAGATNETNDTNSSAANATASCEAEIILEHAPGAVGGCVYDSDEVPNATTLFVDVTKWVLSGMVLGSELEIKDARLSKAAGYARNLLLSVQAHVKEEDDDEDADALPVPVEVQLSIAALPEQAAPIARAADDRIGYWNLHYWEVGSQNGAPGSPLSRRQANRAVRIIHRWRLEHDPDAPPPTAATGGVAPAVKPITYYIDPSVPERWRSAVKAGVEAWAPAFEQAGFSHHLRARCCSRCGLAGRLCGGRRALFFYLVGDLYGHRLRRGSSHGRPGGEWGDPRRRHHVCTFVGRPLVG